MVPLRFVAEASGKEVSWNDFNRTILISSREEQILHTIYKNTEYSNQYNLEGYMSTYNESYEKYDEFYDAGGMWTCVNEGTPTITTIDSTK